MPAGALPESTPPSTPLAAVTAPVTSAALAASPAVATACQRISTRSLLKLDGDFGTFHGYASSVGPQGLGGLRQEARYPSVGPPARWPGTVSTAWTCSATARVRAQLAARSDWVLWAEW